MRMGAGDVRRLRNSLPLGQCAAYRPAMAVDDIVQMLISHRDELD